jgi:L-asparaginase
MTSRTAALTGGDASASGLPRRVVVLGTGGTIAGTSARPGDHVGYTAAQRGIEELLGSLGPPLGVERSASLALEAEQVAQIDSKDMSHAVWRRLAERAAWHLARPDVVGVVVTHGTDTLEETAYLLHRVLAPDKPLVLTAAMRPADALMPDGPQNLLDAITVAVQGASAGLGGVLLALAGRVWAAAEVRKVHPYRLDAFDAGDAGPLAHIEQGALRRLRTWPAAGGPAALGLQVLAADIWPEVQIVTSHAGADGRIVELLLDAGVQGLVVACTGNGSIHQALLAELLRAQQRGVLVLRALRQGSGCIVPGGASVLADAGSLTPSQARVELLLRLLARQPG